MAPSAVGYQPTLAEEMGCLQERITSTSSGLDHSIQAVKPADDLTEPVARHHLSTSTSTVVLSRDIAALASTPPSIRWILRPVSSIRWLSAKSTTIPARGVQQTLQRYKELRDIIVIRMG